MSKKLITLILATVMLVSTIAPVFAQETNVPFVFGQSNMSQKFSPFYSDTAYDQDVVEMTNISLMTTDRVGAIIYNGIEGETHSYNGKDYTYHGAADLSVVYDEAEDITTYTAKLRDDLVFSDGEPLTADDVIFTYYVYLDPAYVGSTTLNSYKILGLQDYLTQTTSDVYSRFETIAKDIQAAGSDHEWTEADAWTKEQQDAYWALIESNWVAEVQKISDYVYTNYAKGYAEETMGMTPEEIGADEGLKVAFGMVMWGFGEVADGVLTAKSGATFDLKAGVYPTINDYYNETYSDYAGDAEKFFSVEAVDSKAKSIVNSAKDTFISQEGSKAPEMAGGIPNIAGIKKTG